MARGRLLSVSQGNYIGSVPPYGFNKIWVTEGKTKYPTLEENKEEADIVRLIFDMYVNQGVGRNLICKHLDNIGVKPPKGKHWSPEAIRDMLANTHYIGKVKWNWRKTVTIVEDSEIMKTRPKSKSDDMLIFDGKHPAIISEELFNLAQDKIGRNHRAKSTTKVRNPLAGLLYCKCGRAMSMRTYKNKGETTASPRLLCDDQVHCGNGSCLYDEIIDFVADNILKSSIADFEMKMKNENANSVKMHEKLIRNLEKKLIELEETEVARWDAQTDPHSTNKMPDDVFKRLTAKLQNEKEETKKALASAYESMPKPIDYKEKIFRFQQALDMLKDNTVSAEEKNKHLKECIERIEYSREKPRRVRRTEDDKMNEALPIVNGWTTPPINIEVKLKV